MKDYTLNENGVVLSVFNDGGYNFSNNTYEPVNNFPPAPISGNSGDEVLNPTPFAPLPFDFGGGEDNLVQEPTPTNYYPNVTGFVSGGGALPVVTTPTQELVQAIASGALQGATAATIGNAIAAGIVAAAPPTKANVNLSPSEIPPIKQFEKTKKMVKWGLIIVAIVVVGFIAYSFTNKDK